MNVSSTTWGKYIKKLAAVNQKAADLMQEYIDKHGLDDPDAMIAYGYALATKYGEAAAAFACEMYDALALAQGASVPAAVPAATATYGEVAKAINGTRDISGQLIPQSISRLVKQAGADTTLQNVGRDGAQAAWIPQGDTCAYCLAIAAEGWQYMSKDMMHGGHAEHIHANCDCAFAVRFDEKSTVGGYNPDRLQKMYYSGGDTAKDRINAIRRANYAEHKDEINAQKRAAYARRKEEEE